MGNIKIEGLDVNMTVSEGEGFEAELKKAEDAINKAIDTRFEQLEQEMTDIKQQRDDAVDDMNAAKEQLAASQEFEKSVKNVFGEDMTIDDMKKVKATADAYMESLIAEVIKYGAASGLIPNDRVDDKKKFFAKLSIEENKEWLEQYKAIHDQRNSGPGILAENSEDKNPADDKPIATVKHPAQEQAFREPL